ncbi:MAG: UDP-glucuronate decarboxylase [Alphaproteobacteria bacterium]|jgi:UDP-glucuronate decarboxylase|nr:UDP-glucuronate decarboxylase [Alphaproteobacteria bacterium]
MNTGDAVTGPINLGHPDEYTIRTLAERIIALTGSRSHLAFKTRPPDDPERRQPDITKARTILDWSPRVQLDQGLERTIEYFEKMLSGSRSVDPRKE